MERLEKLEYLKETLAKAFFGRAHEQSIFVEELVRWMGEDDFNDFYDSFCSNWGIKGIQSRAIPEWSEGTLI